MNAGSTNSARCAAFALAWALSMLGSVAMAQTQQDHVHHMAGHVMPFDVSKTVHIFKMSETGGVERVLVNSPGAADQVELIRQHLTHEAQRFQQGDYSDPATLHGAAMPGLKELQAGARQIRVTYAPVTDGAQITFETTDLHMLTALHRWFGSQLSEHGADARTE